MGVAEKEGDLLDYMLNMFGNVPLVFEFIGLSGAKEFSLTFRDKNSVLSTQWVLSKYLLSE